MRRVRTRPGAPLAVTYTSVRHLYLELGFRDDGSFEDNLSTELASFAVKLTKMLLRTDGILTTCTMTVSSSEDFLTTSSHSATLANSELWIATWGESRRNLPHYSQRWSGEGGPASEHDAS